MCSIGGWISTDPLDPTTAMLLTRALIFYGAPRGRQSSGVWSAGTIVKRAMDPSKFINIRAFRTLMETPSSMALTHTRQPTCGGTGDQQAQPFQLENTITVHNGCISNIGQTIEKFGLSKASGVDSELFTSFIAKHGIEALPDFFKFIVGSAAVAAVHGGNLYLMRSSNPVELFTLDLGNKKYLTVFGSTEQQVMNAIRNVWLLDLSNRTKTLPWDKVVKLSANGDTEEICDLASRRFSTVYGSGDRTSEYEAHGWVTTSMGQHRRACKWDREQGCLVDVNSGKPV